MSSLRAGLRLLRSIAHVVAGLWIAYWRFPSMTYAQQQHAVSQWSHQLLHHMGLRLCVRGDAVMAGPLLLVANHISWADITVIHATRFCRFVSKADVKHWPVIGTLARAVGTLFIERESRRDAMRVVHHMAQSLGDGDVLAVFPEGTTSDGLDLLPFHANLLQAAISAQAPVQPVGIRFVDGSSGRMSQVASYVGDDWLVASIWRTLSADHLTVEVTFGEPQFAVGRDRRTWAADLRQAIIDLRRADQ